MKRLSKTSQQGLQEFENEVKLTARLQHVNLVPVVGICTKGRKDADLRVYAKQELGLLHFW